MTFLPEQPVRTFQPEACFALLGPDFADPVAPARFPRTVLRWRDQRAAALVGLDGLDEAGWLAHFGRLEPLPGTGAPPLAMRYHGHQFRSYNPDIGDGRGFLLTQLRRLGDGQLMDLGTKGSGTTPWSRFGDGRLTLKGGVREVLAARMLEALGVPTSRALSLVETGEALQRNDEPSPTRSAVLVRLQRSHIRFGTFQRHAFERAPERLTALVDHAVEHYHPHLAQLEGEARVAGFMRTVSEATARLVASWMGAGFVHGVLNTDNMTITGESFDYGPWRFLPHADASFTAAYFDHTGLYAYGRQPEAGLWNLRQLAGALSLICDPELLADAVRAYGAAFGGAQRAALAARLGVVPLGPDEDKAMFDAMFAFMATSGIDWNGFFHDWFCGEASAARAATSPRAGLYAGETFAAWRTLLAGYQPQRPERLAHPWFARPDPEGLVIGEVEAVWEPIAQGDDWSAFHAKLAAIDGMGEALALQRL
jgi:serine/tyrosine/threonine adenylyltransferase